MFKSVWKKVIPMETAITASMVRMAFTLNRASATKSAKGISA